MIFIKFFILCLLSITLYSKEMYFDTISLSKIKKVIKKEEQIAKAYKKYIMDKALKPTSISNLESYLPKGFSYANLFGKSFSLHPNKAYIVNEIPLNVKSALYDKYYSNENRVHSKAPLSKKSKNIQIVFSDKENYILNLLDPLFSKITRNEGEAKNKYFLDDKGILHWYDNNKIVYSLDKNLIIYEDLTRTDTDGGISSAFKTIIVNNDILFPGQQILNIENGIAYEYINIGGEIGIIKVGDTSRDIGKTIIQFSRRAGGMIVNGDIYTWGNNANKIVGLNSNIFTGSTERNRYPVITGLVRAKAKSYNTNIDRKNYFSSPLRPKFNDFFSTVYHSTCGVTISGAVYCGGHKGVFTGFGSNFNHVEVDSSGTAPSSTDPEMLYRSTFFNGIDKKAKKMFANNQIWHILSKDGDIYIWGSGSSGFAGTGSNGYYPNSKTNPDKKPITLNVKDDDIDVKFSDITYQLTMGHRRIAALSKDKDIYIWGNEEGTESLPTSGNCTVTWDNVTKNRCRPLKVVTNIAFESIAGGLESFVAVSTEGEFYKIYQPGEDKPIVLSVNEKIKNDYSNVYNAEDDAEILSVDFSSKLEGSTLKINEGIVWVNGKNQLKGDYFTSENVNDNFFKHAIAQIKWKKIKVIQDNNGMCGIDTFNQMYCWGKMSFNRTGSHYYDYMGNTFMLPVFNTNLYDLKSDFLVAEGGYDAYLTKMTSGDWNPSGNDFFMKYPTYIGGFNYEFEFK